MNLTGPVRPVAYPPATGYTQRRRHRPGQPAAPGPASTHGPASARPVRFRVRGYERGGYITVTQRQRSFPGASPRPVRKYPPLRAAAWALGWPPDATRTG